MLQAITSSGLSEAWPGAKAQCPLCRQKVIAHCGSIITWHWAHAHDDECDEWAEHETQWHREWKMLAPAHRREVTIGKHRADVVTKGGTVLEFQHSSISPEVIKERELYYGRMAWVFDARKARHEKRLVRWRNMAGGFSFRWKQARKSVAFCDKPVLLDVGEDWMWKVRSFHIEAPCYGFATPVKRGAVVTSILENRY